MPFPWMRVSPAPSATSLAADSARELKARAGLLRRLGHDQEAVVARCRQNLAWEFDQSGPVPLDEAAVRALVRAVFER